MDRHVKIILSAPLVIIAGISMLQMSGPAGDAEADAAADHVAERRNRAADASGARAATPYGDVARQPGPKGSTIVEQAILDAFPTRQPAEGAYRRRAEQAADYLAATINAAGHLCDRPLEAQKADGSHYGISCRTRRGGSDRSHYLVNIGSGAVNAI